MVLDLVLSRGVTIDEIFTRRGDALCQVASVWEDPVLIELLRGHGATAVGTEGRGTVLHGLATRATTREELETWISRGARLEARDESGETPWLVACNQVQLVTARALASLGANVHATDARGPSSGTSDASLGRDRFAFTGCCYPTTLLRTIHSPSRPAPTFMASAPNVALDGRSP